MVVGEHAVTAVVSIASKRSFPPDNRSRPLVMVLRKHAVTAVVSTASKRSFPPDNQRRPINTCQNSFIYMSLLLINF